MPALVVLPLALAAIGAFDHGLLDGCLRRHVVDGLVDYRALQADPDFGRYRASLAAAAEPAEEDRLERMAFWINAYNAAVLMGVVDHLPLRSVRDVGPEEAAFFRRLRFRVAGRDRTLDEIENGILRPQFGDPRVHFALVCAARGCPPLRPSAWRAGSLDADLEAATRRFVSDPARVRLEENGSVARVSPIFQWYAADFERAGGVVAFLSRYAPSPIPPSVRLEYLDYSWDLNDAARSPGSGGVIDSAP